MSTTEDKLNKIAKQIERYQVAEYRRTESQMTDRTPDKVYTARLERLEEKLDKEMDVICAFKNLMLKYRIDMDKF